MSLDKESPSLNIKELTRESWQEYLDTLPKVPSGSGKKRYAVGCYTPEDWDHIHKVLMEDGTLEDNIPKDSIECVDDKKISKTRAIYLLDDLEVESLKNHPKVKYVAIDESFYEGTFKPYPGDMLDLDRYASDVKNYRNLNNGSNLNRSINRTGYQSLRSGSKVDAWKGSSDTTIIDDKLEYIGDGKDVDVIVADNCGWYGHPEFNNSTGNGPQLYTGGNVLPGNGTCDVLDLCLHAPYYLDPEWFDTPNSPGQPGYLELFYNMDSDLPNPSLKKEIRWDGTEVPRHRWAHRWWKETICRSHVDDMLLGGTVIAGGFSSTFPDFGSIYLDPDYDEEFCNGSNEYFPGVETFNIFGTLKKSYEIFSTAGAPIDHATQCMAQAYGRTMGWAFNANKWHIHIIGRHSHPIESYYEMLKVFHENKPNRPSDNTKNPTLATNSWGTRSIWTRSGTYYFRQGTDGSGGVPFGSMASPPTDPPAFMDKIGFYGSAGAMSGEMTPSSTITAGDELIESGVIFVAAAGNNNQKLVNSDHPDYNNYYSTLTQPSNTPLADTESGGMLKTTNRRGHPQQLGKYTDNATGKVVYPVISVGALDDEFDNSGTFHTATGKEKKVDYSSTGEAVDCYAPGDGTLAAHGLDRRWYVSDPVGSNQSKFERSDTYSGFQPALYLDQNTGAPIGSGKAWDTIFGGTSSACPTAAGIIATKLQANRTWGWAEVKDWINDKCGVQSEDDFYYGEEPNTATDSRWADVESLMGGTPKVIWDASTVNEPEPPNDVYGCTDPNATNYDPNATINDGTCEYAPSDWFVGWEKWTPQTAWVKASEGASGWYLTDPQGWSQFMKDYAMFPSNTEILADQDHTAIWEFNLPNPGTYTLECQCDGTATFVWDTTTTLGTITSGPLPTGPHNTSTNYTVTANTGRNHWVTATINNGGIPGYTDWNMNPGGVAWVLKDARVGEPTFGNIVARSSDSFPQSPSGAWGSFMNTYAVFASTTDPLVGQQQETTYVFTHGGGQVILEVASDGDAIFLIDDVTVGSTSNAFTSDTITVGGSGFTSSVSTSSFQNGVPAGNRKLTVRTTNTSSAAGLPNTWPANPGGVAFVVKNASGTVLKTSLNVGQQPTPTANTQVLGCTDPNATNYDPNANVDDGSCTYGPIYGCTDPNATNYNPNATIDDGSCTYQGGNNNLEQKDVLNTVHFPVMSNVKFSQLRNTFRDKNPSGTIKASELRRRTSKTNMDPVVPDSTENTPIATTTNWKVSQFQNSRKYYMIETSSTSTSTINIGGLAWNSNMNKNIRKWYYIKHDCESLNPNQPAFNINEEIVNFTLDLQADVHGAGGLRGGEVPSSSAFNWPNSTTHGGPGGDAVRMTGTANSNNFGVWLRSNSELFGGGGGGGRGGGGTKGPDGPCWSPRATVGNLSGGWGEWYSYSRGDDCQCEYYIGCGNFLTEAGNNQITINDPGGYLHGRIYDTQTHDSNGDSVGDSLQIGSGTYSSHKAGRGCSCWFNFFGIKICRRTCIGPAYCAVDDPAQKPGAPGGAGGYGGLGQGGNQNRETNGMNGLAGTPKNCPTYASVGNTGGIGGAGGDWGQSGTSGGNDIIPPNDYGRNTGPGPQAGGPGGAAGRAVRGTGYAVAGSTGNIKGGY